MKLFGKNFNILSLWILLILLVNVELTNIGEAVSELNGAEIQNQYSNTVHVGEFTAEQQKKFDSIKKPDLPLEMSDDIRFMQREISKAYSAARNEANPRFAEAEAMNKKFMSLFPEDKRDVGVPVNRAG